MTLLLSAFTFSNARGQIQKGTVFLGGGISYNNYEVNRTFYFNSTLQTDKTINSFFGVNPTLHYFIKQNIALNVSTGISYSKYYSEFNQAPGFKYNSTAVPLRIGANKYINLNQQILFFTGLYAGTSISVSNNSSNNTKEDRKSYNAGIELGMMWFPHQRIGISLNLSGLGYSQNKNVYSGNGTDTDQTMNASGFNFNLNQAVTSIGFSYILNNRKSKE